MKKEDSTQIEQKLDKIQSIYLFHKNSNSNYIIKSEINNNNKNHNKVISSNKTFQKILNKKKIKNINKGSGPEQKKKLQNNSNKNYNIPKSNTDKLNFPKEKNRNIIKLQNDININSQKIF